MVAQLLLMIAAIQKYGKLLIMFAGKILNSLVEHATAHGGRSTALWPLISLAALLLPGALVAGFWGPTWLAIGIFVALCTDLGLLLFAYWHFMRKNPDLLRSESFTIQKMAIQQGLLGDDTSGVIDIGSEEQEVRSVSSTTVDALRIGGAK